MLRELFGVINIMENIILVSILIPLYNKEKWFERCFNSVIKQSYKYIECVIVEDCSTDNSLKLAEYLINNYIGTINFVLVKHEINGGLSAARNTGIINSKGEYVYFLDADDEITENCIDSLIKLVNKYPEVDFVQGNSRQYPYSENDYYANNDLLPEYVIGNAKIKKKYSNVIPVNSWNKLIKKYFITNNYLYFKNGIIHEDKHWIFFAFKKINSFAFTDNHCYIRHIVPDSIMTNENLLPSFNGYLTIVDDILSNLDADLLEYQIKEIYSILTLKERLFSDEKYSSLRSKYIALSDRVPKGSFFLLLGIREIRRDIIRKSRSFLRKIFGNKLSSKIKRLFKI